MTDVQGYYDTAVTVAKQAGQIVLEALQNGDSHSITTKGGCSADMVTETDTKVEQFIISSIKKVYPNHQFIGEETSLSTDFTDAPTWIIDPIDGTTNFIHRFPYSAICIGLTINKEVVVGVIYNFFQDQLFSAKKGGGAYMNDRSIHVSDIRELQKAIVVTDLGYSRKEFELTPKLATIQGLAADPSHVHGIRTLGSSALSLCMVAVGGADAYIEYGIHCWDYAAGELLVREAGGVSLYPTGAPLDLMGRGVLVSCTKELADAMIPLIHHVDYPRD